MRKGADQEVFLASCTCGLLEHPGMTCENAVGVIMPCPDYSGPSQLDRIEEKLDKLLGAFYKEFGHFESLTAQQSEDLAKDLPSSIIT